MITFIYTRNESLPHFGHFTFSSGFSLFSCEDIVPDFDIFRGIMSFADFWFFAGFRLFADSWFFTALMIFAGFSFSFFEDIVADLDIFISSKIMIDKRGMKFICFLIICLYLNPETLFSHQNLLVPTLKLFVEFIP